MREVSGFRLYGLRAMYLFIVAGLGIYLWPGVLRADRHWGLEEGYSNCMLAAFSLLCVLGVRYPLRMLPVLLWEVTWKTLWLVLVPLAQWRATGRVNTATQPAVIAVGMVVLVYAAIPWGYVWERYGKGRSALGVPRTEAGRSRRSPATHGLPGERRSVF